MLQHILNPAFLHSFEKGEGEQLLGPPNPEGDNPESITSVFITKVYMHAHGCRRPFFFIFSIFFPHIQPAHFSSQLSLFIAQQLCLPISHSDFITFCTSSHNVLSVQHISILGHHQLHPTLSDSSSLLNCWHPIFLFFLFVSSIRLHFSLPPPTSPPAPPSVTFHSSGQTIIPGVNVMV